LFFQFGPLGVKTVTVSLYFTNGKGVQFKLLFDTCTPFFRGFDGFF